MSETRVGERAAREGAIGFTIWGLILAPLVGGSASMGVLTALSGVFSGTPLRAFTDLPFAISFGALGGAILGIPAALIAGPPVYLLMKRAGMSRLSSFALFGGLIALLPCLLVSGPMILSYPASAGPIIALFALAGAIGGLTFWLIRRPDRDAPLPTPTEESEA